MKFAPALIIVAALLNPSFPAFADGYLLGEGPDTTVAFNEEELVQFLNKYRIPFKIEQAYFNKNHHYYDVAGYQLRNGVFMLQTAGSEKGGRADLVLANEDLARKFEKELVETTSNGTTRFYEKPVIGIADEKVIALAYLLPPDPSGVVRTRHYFIANPWKWEPEEDE